ncbi:MAG: hypothetical protein K0U52_10045 [Gammaproteobacteria bacterium]|nr:hypothetical protein [Gammaproteobacteria bacterium]
MSIKSVLNNNISLQTNILESRGHYPRDVVCQNLTVGGTVLAPTISGAEMTEAATATAGGILRGLAFTLPATTANENDQVLTITYPAAHGWTADDQILEVVQNQSADGSLGATAQTGLITAGFGGATEIKVYRCLGNIGGAGTERLTESYVELRIIDRNSTS